MEVGQTWPVVMHELSTIEFTHLYSVLPVFVVVMQTANEMDTATIRYTVLGTDDAGAFVEKEKSNDYDTDHLAVNVGFIVFGTP